MHGRAIGRPTWICRKPVSHGLARRRPLERSANFGDGLVAIFVQFLKSLLQRPKFSGAFGRPFPINVESLGGRWTRRGLRGRQRRLHRYVATVGGRHFRTPYKTGSSRIRRGIFSCGRAPAIRLCTVQCVAWMPGRGRFGGKRWTAAANKPDTSYSYGPAFPRLRCNRQPIWPTLSFVVQ